MYALSDYDYHLPEERIAQKPAIQRDRSKLLALGRNSGQIRHQLFNDLVDLLQTDDVLVVNNTAVVPARLFGRKESGGKIELLLLDYPEKTSPALTQNAPTFQCLIKASKRPLRGTRLLFKKGITAVVTGFKNGIFDATFSFPKGIDHALDAIGHIPLPPYIQRNEQIPPNDDTTAYQTVYAKVKGAVAAPTAGLHFTPHLIERLITHGIKIIPLTLHVGYGTFSPVRANDIRDHLIHTEPFQIPKESAHAINQAKNRGRRIIAVGTTSCRALEYAADESGQIVPSNGLCDLFIYPGYRFKAIDGLITNFHLPQSTLLMLVSALAGRNRILSAYREAIQQKYRFYSYGDAMLIL